MRILHFGPAGAEANFFSLLTGFMNLGHEVRTCNVIRRDDVEVLAENAITEFKPDFVITVGGWHAHYDAPKLWTVIKKHAIPNVYWAIEDPTFFDWVSAQYVREYDFVFTVSEEYLPKYAEYGVPSAFLPYACNPQYHRPVEIDDRYKNDIIAMANKVKEYDPARNSFRNKSFKDIVLPIMLGNYDIKLYGNAWETYEPKLPEHKLGGYISAQDVLKAYSAAKINLAIQWDYSGHICYRIYEALACGCFVISPYTEAQAKFFTHGRHIIYSHNEEETKMYVDYYLRHDEERQQIALQGQEEVYKNHNCSLRAAVAMFYLKQNKLIS